MVLGHLGLLWMIWRYRGQARSHRGSSHRGSSHRRSSGEGHPNRTFCSGAAADSGLIATNAGTERFRAVASAQSRCLRSDLK